MTNPIARPFETDVNERRDWPSYVFPAIFAFGIPLVVIYLAILSFLLFHFPSLKIQDENILWPFDTDFLNYWSAARLALGDHIMSLFDSRNFVAAQQALIGHAPVYQNNWAYPPHFLPLILGLGLLPYRIAFVVWIVSTFALYAFAVAYKRPQAWKLTAALALAPASFCNLYFGQNGFLIAALFVGGLRLIDRRPALAGIAFGLLTFKPQFMVLLPIVIHSGKHWRVLAVAALTAAILVAISLALWGTEPWAAYYRQVVPYQLGVLETLDAALRAFAAMRAKEGEALLVDFLARTETLRRHAEAISVRASQVAPAYREQLLKRLREAGLELKLDDERVLKEIALFADRCDISEEITRFRSHLDQFVTLLKSNGEIGRKADFILQEIGREVNTTGAKANDLAIAKHVIELKNELERIREQIANVE